MTPARRLDLLGTVVRLALAAIWLISGGIKIADPMGTAVAVDAYRVLPSAAVSVVASVLPLLELALGALLLLGLATRLAAVVSAVVLLAFLAGLAQAWARGLSIDCGCFGGGGPVPPGAEQYPLELGRDLGFLALAGWLAVRPATLVAVDGIGRRGHGDIRREPARIEGES